ncbi:nodulation protein NodN [Croceicoccus estronivorus]|nr:nodulation protein NodN [Croceicoccus estronivorus]
MAAQKGRSYTSEWMEIDQEMIDGFAQTTRDFEFIHVDPVRAAETHLGGTVAHGFLILSLIPHLRDSTQMPIVPGVVMGLNYGVDHVRFTAPVRSGTKVRGVFTIADTVEKLPNNFQQTLDIVVERQGLDKPAMVARWLVHFAIAGDREAGEA